ncbi:tyrosine-type recombinase/integrase [Deinococcus cavernae]|uniref:tyrosine-type recombinase/integrase n=1 Tax=Deinococcus cavernae TaxID=2320857 RepID=UPI001314B1CD|nr:tyrosine-type recombinase/integrase [Deinococcus cavernae]
MRFYHQAVTDLERHMEREKLAPELENVTRGILIMCQADMTARGMRDGAIAAYMRGLRGFFSWALEEDLIERNPMRKMPVPSPSGEPPAAIQPHEVQACLAVVKAGAQPRRDTAILTLLYDTGLRLGEVCGLRVGDVSVETGMLTVRGETSKTSARVVPLGIRSARALMRYMHRERRPALPTVEEVFLSKAGTPLTHSGVSQLLNRVAEGAGLPRDHVAPHAWRRGFAVQALRNGADLFTVQTILGHSTLAMTRRYVRYLPTDIQRSHLRASPADRL